jgi:hypothetical protein
MSEDQKPQNPTTGTLRQREDIARRVFIARLRAADASWNQTSLISMAHAAANEIERLCKMLEESEAAYEAACEDALERKFRE